MHFDMSPSTGDPSYSDRFVSWGVQVFRKNDYV